MSNVNPAVKATACLAYMTAFYATMSLVGVAVNASLVTYAGIAGLAAIAASILIRRWWTAYLVMSSYAVSMAVAAVSGHTMLAVASAVSAALYFTSMKAVESEETGRGGGA